METRAASRFFELAVVFVFLACPAIHAQIPHRLERCLPYPTFAQEIENANQEANQQTPQPRVVIIEDVEFDGLIHLSETGREKFVPELKQYRPPADSRWIEGIEEAGIRGAWQDEGYFTVLGRAKAQVLYADAEAQHVSLIITVDEGLQYRLESVQLRPVDPETATALFPPAELRKAIPLRDGDLFDVSKIREGLDALRRLYSSEGYIDFTAMPVTDVDNEGQRISLIIELDEQKQFRVGKVEILGLAPKTESLLRSKLKPGDIFNSQILEDFYKNNKSALPEDTSPADKQLIRNVKQGTVDLVFDFRTCPQPED